MTEEVNESVQHMQQPKVAGSTWLTSFCGQDWPVVLCNASTTPEKFFGTRQRDDETPGILLGKHKYIWVATELVAEFDPCGDYELPKFDQPEILPHDDEATKSQKQRVKAFEQDAREFRDDKFWSNYVKMKSEARRIENERNRRHSERTGSSKKRKITREDDEIPFASEGKRRRDSSAFDSTGSGKQRNDSSSSPGSQQEQLPTPKQTPNKNRVGPETSNSRGFTNDSGSPNLSAGSGSEVGALRVWSPPKMSTDKVKVVIDRSKAGIIIPREALKQCDYLASLEKYHAVLGHHVIDLTADKQAVALNLTEKEFSRLEDYFYTNDIGPQLLPDKDYDSKDPFGELEEAQKSLFGESLALAFVPACKIRHEPLQALIRDKIRALDPLPPFTILVMATVFANLPAPETVTEYYLQDWMADHLAESYWVLARKYPEVLQRGLEEHDTLRRAVYSRLAVDGKMGKKGFDGEL
ncbi:Hypothetical predicted protein [Lecanosticta acicola]|uniref:Uncharacterized protein n=1 Tax=Lecanosticta acicola TaxID=111012 RepID=A0AAI8Z900_9PEZI|nr:Hypothetical predicted protein [Lecanosticta acicola]